MSLCPKISQAGKLRVTENDLEAFHLRIKVIIAVG